MASKSIKIELTSEFSKAEGHCCIQELTSEFSKLKVIADLIEINFDETMEVKA